VDAVTDTYTPQGAPRAHPPDLDGPGSEAFNGRVRNFQGDHRITNPWGSVTFHNRNNVPRAALEALRVSWETADHPENVPLVIRNMARVLWTESDDQRYRKYGPPNVAPDDEVSSRNLLHSRYRSTCPACRKEAERFWDLDPDGHTPVEWYVIRHRLHVERLKKAEAKEYRPSGPSTYPCSCTVPTASAHAKGSCPACGKRPTNQWVLSEEGPRPVAAKGTTFWSSTDPYPATEKAYGYPSYVRECVRCHGWLPRNPKNSVQLDTGWRSGRPKDIEEDDWKEVFGAEWMIDKEVAAHGRRMQKAADEADPAHYFEMQLAREGLGVVESRQRFGGERTTYRDDEWDFEDESSWVDPDPEAEDLAEGMAIAMRALTDKQREALRLVYWQDASFGEAAKMLGINKSAFQGQYERAREALRRSIASVIAEVTPAA
jgi:DNA-directed RNA polymerase specialized sigma24 family protein